MKMPRSIIKIAVIGQKRCFGILRRQEKQNQMFDMLRKLFWGDV
jgi:hypothetical protein